MMVIYVPVKFEFDWTNRFRVRVWKRKCGRTDKRTNERTELHQFRKEPSYDGGLCPCQEFDLTNRFRIIVQKRKCGWTDGWTDKWTKNGQTNRWNFANLISKLNFYKLIPYPMDNCFTGRAPTGPAKRQKKTSCKTTSRIGDRVCIVLHFLFTPCDVKASFSCLRPLVS